MNIFFPPSQERVILVMLVFGALSGVLYDIFRIKRRFFGSNKIVLFLDDLIFSFICVIMFLFSVFAANDGRFRWFEPFLAAIGYALYMLSLSHIVLIVFYKVIDWLKLLIKSTFSFICLPLKMLFTLVGVIVSPALNWFTRKCYKRQILICFRKISSVRKCK